MRTAISILQKVLVNHFYKLNAGLFLFLFFVLFGLPQDVKTFHTALATAIIQSPVLLLAVMVIWFLYNLKCIDYVIKHLKEPQQQFLACLQSRGAAACFFFLYYVHFFVYLPVILYALFLIIAIKNAAYLPVAEIIIFITVITSVTPLLYIKTLQGKFFSTRIYLFTSFVRIPKPFFVLPLFYIWHNRKQMLLLTKFFSTGVLFLFLTYYTPEVYDIRPLLLCLLLSAASHCTIVFEIRNFENEYLAIARNFPFTSVERFIQIICMYAVLMLPELIFVWKGFPLHFHTGDYFQLMLLTVALPVLLHTCLLTGNIAMRTFIKIVFGISMAIFFIVLYNPGILLPAFLLFVSFLLFNTYCYEFEK